MVILNEINNDTVLTNLFWKLRARLPVMLIANLLIHCEEAGLKDAGL